MSVTNDTDSSVDEHEDKMNRCEQRIAHVFGDRELLRAALTHASGADHRLSSNERLEFLGDAILGFVVCEHLYHLFPEYLEGDLTKIKSVLVSRRTCAKISERLRLHDFLIVGKGMASSPALPDSLLSDVLEALVAAIYLDAGIEAARRFVMKNIRSDVEAAMNGGSGGNYKSLLQQYAQRVFGATPVYVLMDEKGPDHSKCFMMAAQVGGRRYEAAWGKNKKEAEQGAARNALGELRPSNSEFDETETEETEPS